MPWVRRREKTGSRCHHRERRTRWHGAEDPFGATQVSGLVLERSYLDVLELLAHPAHLRRDVGDPACEDRRDGERREPREGGDPAALRRSSSFQHGASRSSVASVPLGFDPQSGFRRGMLLHRVHYRLRIDLPSLRVQNRAASLPSALRIPRSTSGGVERRGSERLQDIDRDRAHNAVGSSLGT